MEIKINLGKEIKQLIEKRAEKTEKHFSKEIDKLKKRVMELELKNSDAFRMEFE